MYVRYSGIYAIVITMVWGAMCLNLRPEFGDLSPAGVCEYTTVPLYNVIPSRWI